MGRSAAGDAEAHGPAKHTPFPTRPALQAHQRAGHQKDDPWRNPSSAELNDGFAALAELRTRAASGDPAAPDGIATLLAKRGDDESLAELQQLVLCGVGGELPLHAYRKRSPDRHILELNCVGDPIYDDMPSTLRKVGETPSPGS